MTWPAQMASTWHRTRLLDTGLDQAMLLGSADILLTELVGCSPPAQQAVLRQVAVCRAPMTLDDLAFTLAPARPLALPDSQPDLAALRADVDRLTDLTLLTAGDRHHDAPVDRRPGHPQHAGTTHCPA